MQRRRPDLFSTIRTEGALLPPELLARIARATRAATAAADRGLPGLAPADYHLDEDERLPEVIGRAWNGLLGAWAAFQDALGKLPPTDPATGVTRDRWLLRVFRQLGYGQFQTARSVEIAGRSVPLSHAWGPVPIHLVGARVLIDKRTPGVAGAATTSPHGLVQDLLNASDEHLWGIVSNGFVLRLLRDNRSLTRQAYVEFDLQAMMEGEVYADFAVLYLVLHQSRLEPRAASEGAAPRPEGCWLERWSKEAEEIGTRALAQLRDGVEHAIEALGRGFLVYQPKNASLHAALRSGTLSDKDAFGELKVMRGTLRPRIVAHRATGGVALSTLAVLSFDLMALAAGIEGIGCHPGLLIHDGPREADLSRSIYVELFRHVARLETAFEDRPPNFQYLVTTTEPPPDELCRDPWLLHPVLDASTPSTKLLRLDL